MSVANQDRTVHLAVCPDHRAALPAAVVIASAARSLAPDWELQVWLLDCGLHAWQRSRLESVGRQNGVRVTVLPCDSRMLEGLPVCRHFSAAMYGRVLLPRLLPSLDRVVYVDTDTVVVADLAELWSIDLDGAMLGAVPNWEDRRSMGGNSPIEFARSELASPEDPYFNSGVLLMDLEACRAGDLEERVRAFVTTHADRLLNPDQDALNYAASGRMQVLDRRWNQQCSSPSPLWRDGRFHGGVCHLVGPYKPWRGGINNPFILAFAQEVWRSGWLRWWEWPAYLARAAMPPRLPRWFPARPRKSEVADRRLGATSQPVVR